MIESTSLISQLPKLEKKLGNFLATFKSSNSWNKYAYISFYFKFDSIFNYLDGKIILNK